MPSRVVALALALLAFSCSSSSTAQAPDAVTQSPGVEAPRLVVVISVDQLRSDYFDWLEPHFGEGGFKRLVGEGVSFVDAAYAHGITETGPGHAVLSTGAEPRVHGVIANSWLDRKTLRYVYCVEDPEHGRSPRNLRVPTLAEAWKRHYGEKAWVLSLSIKDRAACCMGGTAADLALWLDWEKGRLRSSSYYESKRSLAGNRKAVRAWVDALNSAPKRLIDRRSNHVWKRLVLPEAAPKLYAALGKDRRVGERPPNGIGIEFPHVFPKDGPTYYTALSYSPFGHEFLLASASNAIEELKLGKHETPDLLLLSLSSLDYVGHAFGPRSHEVADCMIRLDRQLAAFFAKLDRLVGEGQWTVALSADHGVSELPEEARVRFGKGGTLDVHDLGRHPGIEGEAGRNKGLFVRLSEAIAEKFSGQLGENYRAVQVVGSGQARRVASVLFKGSGSMLYLKPEILDRYGLDRAEVADFAAAWLRKQKEVSAACSLGELVAGAEHRYAKLWAASCDPTRAGDVILSLQPYTQSKLSRQTTGTNHGSPHLYDRRVPIMFAGVGVARAGKVKGVARVRDFAPTLARIVGVPKPSGATGRVLEAALARKD